MTASSWHNGGLISGSHAPSEARLNKTRQWSYGNAGVWAADVRDGNQWVQVSV